MSPQDIEALIRLLDDPRLGQRVEDTIVTLGLQALPFLHDYAEIAPTVANDIIQRIVTTDQEQAWMRLSFHPDAEEAALLLAASFDHFLDREQVKQQLNNLAEPMQGALLTGSFAYQRDALALREWLSRAKRFRANRSNYYDPDNLLLPKVLESRMGVPITLCLVYLLVGRRLKVPVYIIELPHHPVVRYGEEPNALYIDPYNDGALMTEKECRTMFARKGIPMPDTALLPLGDYEVVELLLRALASFYDHHHNQAAKAQVERYREIWREGRPYEK